MSTFRSFGGEFARQRKVSLAGRSRTEESSREEVLERTRQEREKRRQAKLETRSATSIQAVWRSWRSRQQLKAALREQWLARYCNAGERGSSTDLAPGSPYLRELCFFADPAAQADVELLAAASRVILSSFTPAAGPAGAADVGQQQQQQQLVLCSYAASSHDYDGPVTVLRVQRLLALAVAALAKQAAALSSQLQQPRQGGAAALAPSPVGPLAELSIVLSGSDAWKPAVGPVRAAEITAQLLAYAARRGLFSHLAVIAAAALPEDAPPASRQGVPTAEALLTSLVVRLLSVQQAVARRLPAQLDPARLLAGLLCQPLLLQRCPTLRPLAVRLWRQAVASLSSMQPSALAAWLADQAAPAGLSAATAAAALLGNLLEHAAAALKVEGAQAVAAARPAAAQFVCLVGKLLQLLPLQPFFPTKWAGEEEEEEPATEPADGHQQHSQPGASRGKEVVTPVQRLPWDAEELPRAGLLSQLQAVSDAGLLRAVVRLLLPAGSAEEAAAAAAEAAAEAAAGPDSTLQQQQQQNGQALRATAATVQQLCTFLRRLLALPGQRQRVLIALAMGGELVQRLWFSYLRPAHEAGGAGWLPSSDASCDPGWMLPLALFSLAYSSFIMLADDEELFEAQRPLPLAELYSPAHPRGVLSLLKFALWHALWVEAPPSPGGWAPEASALRQQLKAAAGKLMGQLYDRNCRRSFAPTEAFQAEGLPPERFQADMERGLAAGQQQSQAAAAAPAAPALGAVAGPRVPGLEPAGPLASSLRAWGLLTYAPYLVPFRERAKVFQAMVSQQRAAHRDMEVASALRLGAGLEPSRFVTIRRTHLLQDGYDQLGSLGEALRGRIRIQFIDAHGLEEAGIDGGGIFKEFLEEVVREGFDPRMGLFRATTDQRLYPSPHARALAGSQALRMIEFLGKVLGKAMFEGILVELPLAPFFLKKFAGAYCDINDLPTLDPQLYKSLMFLKHYEGDVSELGLTFTITDDVLGSAQEVELVPGGASAPVTSDNRLAYIHRVADYRLNQQIREPAAAFLRGLHELIQPDWVAMFNEEELQMLVSGGQQGLDIHDMRAHVQYSGGYHDEHPVIQTFWQALASFSPSEQADFLRFVTSCPRPPLLGFRYLEPPFAIQMAGSVLDPESQERLPTAATCLNVLKLPAYHSLQQMREKLLYAINAGAGFELS